MRILHIGKFYPPYAGGMEVFLADLVRAQREAGDEVAVLAHGQPVPDDPEWLKRVPVWGSLVYAPIAPGFPLALRRLLREFRPDVLHLHLPNPSAFAALFSRVARKLPWVVHWHADVTAPKNFGMVGLAYRLYRPFEQRVLAKAERIIATSRPYLEASEALAAWRGKCAVVPLGLDLRRYPDQPDIRLAPWSGTGFRVLALGRLAHYKDFGTLVRAVSGLDDVELIIAGDGEQRTALQAIAAPWPDKFRLLGEVPEAVKHALLASCDVLCLPSIHRSEAFGVVLLEAMRYGRPCVVSDLPGSGMPWVVEEAGAGVLACPGKPESWREAIMGLKNDPGFLRSLGTAGRLALSRRFAVDVCAREVRRQYRLAGCPAMPAAAQAGPLIVIPARDEAETIGHVVGELRSAGFYRVLVVDDGSVDGTAEAARQKGAIVLQAPLPMGAWGAMQTGIRYGLDQGYSEVVTMDADGQHEVSEIQALLLGREEGADVVIGSHPERGSAARRVAWTLFRNLTGFALEDLTSGFRYYNRRAMEVAASNAATLLDYQDVGVLLLLRRARLRVVEVPVSMNLRAVGRSRIFNSWFTVARYMAVTTLLCLARFRPGLRRAKHEPMTSR